MDSFEWNKIFGAVLFALLVGFGLSIFSEVVFETEAPESPGYVIAVAEPAAGGEAETPAATQPIGLLLASADAAAGESSAKKCVTCHSFGEGEANKVGPNLWGVVNNPIAAHEGYAYSEGLRAYAATAEAWTYENLNAFLLDPKGTVAGTKMAFAGLAADPERANVIAYLRSLAAEPAPLPETAPAEPAGDAAAPAEGGAPAVAAAADETPGEGAAPAEEAAPAEAEPQADAPAEGQAPAEEAATAGAPAEPQAAAPAQPAEPAPATEGMAAGGEAGQTTARAEGSLGPVDSAPADQAGTVPQVPAIQQPEPEPPADQAATADAPPPTAPAEGIATAPAQPAQPSPTPAGPAAPPAAAGDQTAAPAVDPAPAPATEPEVKPPPAAPAEQQQAQAEAPAPAAPDPAAPAAPAAPVAPAPAAPAAETPAAPAAEVPAPAAGAPAVAPGDFAALVEAADSAKGQQVAKKCGLCHGFQKDGPNKVGPNLWGVVDRPIASVAGFKYSEAMTAHAEGGVKTWTVDELGAYLENPKAHIPGNKMVFPGVKKADERAAVVAYLRSLSETPVQ